MDGPNCGLGWFCIRHARVQLRHLRGAEKCDRLGLSGMEPQGCCVCELRKRHGCASRPAASRDGNRDSNGTNSVICSHSRCDALGTFPGRGRRQEPRRTGQASQRHDRRPDLVDGSSEGGPRALMPMKTSIKTHEGRVALVTGAAQGIGQAIAVALAERGAQVIATDLTCPHETVEKIGPTAHAFQLDVTQEEDWRSVSVKSRDVGEVGIVVNNAGYFPNRSIDELDLPTWRKTMATNLDSQFLSAKYFLPAMRKKKWGRFVGISSNMVGLAIPGMSHYIASKMGIIGFMRGLANDVANDGITANAVLPGLTNTVATEQQAIKRLGDPEDVTGAVLFLTSDEAAFITGQAIVVDGG